MSAPEYPIRLHRSALRAVSTFALLVAASPCWADSGDDFAQGVEELPPVTVTAPATSAKADGSAAAGYRRKRPISARSATRRSSTRRIRLFVRSRAS